MWSSLVQAWSQPRRVPPAPPDTRAPAESVPEEVSRRVRWLEALTRKLVQERFAGQYHAAFKGQGIDFDEVRPYVAGDEVRSVDWRVTARTGELHVKRYREERELTVWIVVDISASMRFGSQTQAKSEIAAEIAAVLALSAVRNQDRVGLLLFDDHVRLRIPPRKGRRHVMRLIGEILRRRPQSQGTDIAPAIDALGKAQRRRAVVFVLSDFFGEGWSKAMKRLCARHEVIPLVFDDPWEAVLPNVGALMPVRDLETGCTAWLDLHDARHRAYYEACGRRERARRDSALASLQVHPVPVRSDQAWFEALGKAFQQRGRRR